MINRELAALKCLDHPLVNDILEVFVDSKFLYMVSPFYQGGEVNDLLFPAEGKVQPLKEETIRPYVY